jgi:hypothetical protein
MSRDLANRSPDIHWPEGFSPDRADLFSHNELRIEASCERVWKHIVEATKWPQWYPNSKDVQIMGGGDELNGGLRRASPGGFEQSQTASLRASRLPGRSNGFQARNAPSTPGAAVAPNEVEG